MKLAEFYGKAELHRQDRIVFVRLTAPHRTASTCLLSGGVREDITYIVNHQSCEPNNHDRAWKRTAAETPEQYRVSVVGPYGIPPETSVLLGTAANMRNLSVKQTSFRDLRVVVLCTAGVEANAARAGDPPAYAERKGTFELLKPGRGGPFRTDVSRSESPGFGEDGDYPHGTINVILLINKPMAPGALLTAVMTATEAKTTILEELCIPSRYSHHLATGTGTDQISVSALLEENESALTDAGKHSALGALIGEGVRAAVREALRLQNDVTPQARASVSAFLERIGYRGEDFSQAAAAYLDHETADLLQANFTVIEEDPAAVAAAAALVHVWDLICWDIIPETCAGEVIAGFGAELAAAVSGKYSRIPYYRKVIGENGSLFWSDAPGQGSSLTGTLFQAAAEAFAIGFQEKWKEDILPDNERE